VKTSARTPGPGTREAAGPARQIPALTGVRALAAFLVFFHHHPTKLLEAGSLLLWWELHIGVTLFFVLSGFMITWRYDRRGPKPESFLRGYFVNRVARIYPLYLALVIPTMLLGGAKSLHAWILNLTVFSRYETGIPQAWSLRVEECFYLAAPLLFLLWRRSPALTLAVGAAFLLLLYPMAKLGWASEVLGTPRNLMLYTFPGRFFEFYVGIWLAKRVSRLENAEIPAPRRFPAFTLLGIAGIAGVVVALAALRSATEPKYVYGLYHPAGLALNNLVLPVCIAALYWGLIRERSWLRRALSTPVADLLGRSSYAFYLIHIGPLLAYLLGVLVLLAGFFGPAAAERMTLLLGNVAVLFVVVTLLSIGLYKGIEHPANRFIRRRFGGVPSGKT
jgi:peptidoglycan/LPS O-acetylase OafA/YrhL